MADQDMNPAGEMRDPRQMIQDMKTDAREEMSKQRELLDRPGFQFGQADSVKPGTYEGAGGYGYEVMADGSIKIVKAPNDRGLGTVLSQGIAYQAIMDELSSVDQTDSLRGEEMAIQDQMLAESTERFEDRAGGVVAGEGRSGMAMQEEDPQPRKIEMSPEAQLALSRVKSRTATDT